jgi:hypothetical protein
VHNLSTERSSFFCDISIFRFDFMSFERMVVHPPPCGDFQVKAVILNCGRIIVEVTTKRQNPISVVKIQQSEQRE